MNVITIEISGTPIAKPRPRGARTKSGKIIFYTPTKGKRFENIVREHAEKKCKQPVSCAIKMTILFLMPRPQRLIWKTRPMPRMPCDKKPDYDNLAKSATDGLNGVAFYDDAQITDCHIRKRYHAGDEGPKTIITLEEDLGE